MPKRLTLQAAYPGKHHCNAKCMTFVDIYAVKLEKGIIRVLMTDGVEFRARLDDVISGTKITNFESYLKWSKLLD